jgi:hypothetical protein
LASCLNPAELPSLSQEFTMIHHLARAFFVRNAHSAANQSSVPTEQPPARQPLRPVKARPITPWHVPASEPQVPSSGGAVRAAPIAPSVKALPAHPVRISMDPSDRRRTVITGRFAEVCAALDRLVMEQEAAA